MTEHVDSTSARSSPVALARAPFIALTTFRRDGTPVSTPVWCVAQDGALLVFTEAQSGKAKRLRRSSRVSVAPCTARGRPRGPSVDATAEVVEGTEQVEALLAAKYGLVWRGYTLLMRLTRRVRRQPAPSTVTLRITAGSPGPPR